MSPKQRGLYEAESEYKRAVKRAELELLKAKGAHKARVMLAERKLKKVQEQGQEQLGSYSGKDRKRVVLWADRVQVPLDSGSANVTYEEHHFKNGPVEATVDTAGNLAVSKRATLARWAVYGSTYASLFKKTEKHDTRELYLMVEGPDFASLVNCPPDDGPKVRAFAMQITTASKSAASVLQAREQAIAQATQELEAVRNDRAGIEAATKKLEAAKSDTKRLDAAREQLEKDSPAPSEDNAAE